MPVTAILVARNGDEYLPRTLEALSRQSRRVDALVVVDDASGDQSRELLAAAGAAQVVTLDAPRPFGQAISAALREAVPAAASEEWLWLLGHDNAPEPGALAALMGAVEVAPSVAIAGPKLMRWDAPDVIADYGSTLSRFGASVHLVVDELDQGQHDRRSDVLAVERAGMLVRRSVFEELGGFDPALPSVDAALDFCVRVRLAGHRIVGVPRARVASAGGPASFVRNAGPSTTASIARAAQLHRRLTYAPAPAVPLHWLSFLPLALVRAVWLLLSKRPGFVVGDFRAAIAALADGRVPASRRNLARGRRLRWSAIGPFRMAPAEVRRLRSHQRDAHASPVLDSTQRVRASFFSAGGAWIVLFLLAAGALVFGRFIGQAAVSGGAAAPLSATPGELWQNVGVGFHSIGTGFVGAADPFAAVLAVLGSLTFWAPSAAIVVLYVASFALAGLAAWWCASRFSERGWVPAAAAIAWALAPPFLSSLASGHVGSVLTHILLPVLVLALALADRSWAASAASSLVFAVIGACVPSLIPLLFLTWIACLVTHPRSIHRYMGVPVPLVVLFVPLVVDQGLRGNWLGLLADPGVPATGGATSAWHLLIGSAGGSTDALADIAGGLGIPVSTASIAVGVLLLPLAILAVMALFLPRGTRAIPALIVAFFGFVTAVASAHIAVTLVGPDAATIWPGSALSVYWLGILGAAVFAIDALGRRFALTTVTLATALTLLAVPASVAIATGHSDAQPSSGRQLPAYVTAEAASKPWLGTLVLSAHADGSLGARLERGQGATLDDQSTVWSTSTELSPERSDLAELSANIASRSGFDVAAALARDRIAFVVVTRSADGQGVVTRNRAIEALDADAALSSIGATSEGLLWYSEDVATTAVPPAEPTSPFRVPVLIAFAVVFGVILLLAIPTTRRRRSTTTASAEVEALHTAEEDDDD
jgi:GT2 family glycosyltransferase